MNEVHSTGVSLSVKQRAFTSVIPPSLPPLKTSDIIPCPPSQLPIQPPRLLTSSRPFSMLPWPSTQSVTKPLLRTSRTALDAPIHFLLRHPNRRQDRRSLRRWFPENLITCIVTLIPHMTHHMQSSRDSRLSRFHKVSELLSQPPPVSIRKTYSHTHNSRTAQ